MRVEDLVDAPVSGTAHNEGSFHVVFYRCQSRSGSDYPTGKGSRYSYCRAVSLLYRPGAVL